jgi:hypothetical protein
MKSRIFLVATILSVPVAAATDSGHCDSKPFTLKKPAAAQPQPAPAVAPKPKPKPTESSPRAAHAGKSKYVIGCKQAKN